MERISWTEKISNLEVFRRVERSRRIVDTEAICLNIRGNLLLKEVMGDECCVREVREGGLYIFSYF